MLKDGLKVKPNTPLLPYSAMTKQGREEIWSLIGELAEVPSAGNSDG
jgi:GTP-binding protein